MRQRRRRNESRNIGFSAIVSARALKVAKRLPPAGLDGSLRMKCHRSLAAMAVKRLRILRYHRRALIFYDLDLRAPLAAEVAYSHVAQRIGRRLLGYFCE